MNTNSRPADQRRKPRVTIPEHPEIRDAHSGIVLGQLVNLSSEGLMMAGPRPIARNTILQMRIPLTKGERKVELRVGVESLWCEDTNGSGTHWTGFQIIDISPEGQFVLDSVIGT